MNTISIIIILFIIFAIRSFIIKNKKYGPSEKSPLALPFIGHLYLFDGEGIHKPLFKLMNEYGTSFKLWLGDSYTLILTDPTLIREIYIHNFENYIDRYDNPIIKWCAWEYKGLALGNSQHWEANRNLVVSSFSNLKIRKISHIIENQCFKMITAMKSQAGGVINPRLFCKTYSFNIIVQYLFSMEQTYSSEPDLDPKLNRVRELFSIIEGANKAFASQSILDMFDIIAPIRYWYLKNFRTELKTFFNFVQNILDDHISTLDRENPKDLMDSMILQCDVKNPNDIQRILTIGTDLITAGSDTTSSTIETIMLLMANYPHIQEKVYNELKDLPRDDNGLITTQSRPSTIYTNAMIKESMRYKPTGPFNIPRMNKEATTLSNGLYLPPKTQILLFHYGVLYNENHFANPNEYLPERFINNNHGEVFLPFSVGKRNCVGVNLAQDELFVGVANILANFKISPLPGVKTIDESQELGLVFHPKPFTVILEERK